nr:ribonuclease H-like domain-containing protein [Tanacetum cinerariifolium]
MRPFGYPLTILNTLDHLGKFEWKADEGFLVGYSINSKAFRVFNYRTRKVEENLHIIFLENKSTVAGRGPEWLFAIDSLTKSINYEPVTVGNQTNDAAGIEINVNAVQSRQKKAYDHEYILLPFMPSHSPLSSSIQSLNDKDVNEAPGKGDKVLVKEVELIIKKDPSWIEAMKEELQQFKLQKMDVKSVFMYGIIEEEVYVCQPPGFKDPHFLNKVYKVEKALYGLHQALKACTQDVNPVEPSINTTNTNINTGSLNINIVGSNDLSMPSLEETGIFNDVYDDREVGTEADTNNLELSTVGKKIINTKASIRRDFRLDDAEGTACLPNAAIFEELARMGAKTTALNEFSSTMASAIICLANNQKFNFSMYTFESMMKSLEAGEAQIQKETEVPHTKEHIPTPSHDPLPSGEDRMQLSELMEICTKLSDSVLSLEQIKTNQAAKIEKLKKKVKKLEGKKKKITHGLKRLYKVGLTARVESYEEEEGLGDQEDPSKQGRIAEIDVNEDLSLITSENIERDAIAKEKGKGIMVEPEKPLKKKDQIALDEEVARKLEAEMKAKIDEKEMIAREKNESNRAVIKEWDDVQAIIDYFAAKRAKKVRNKPPTKAQQKSLMCTYMKNIEGYKQKDFKGKSFDAIKKMFDKVYKRVNTFVAMDLEVMEGSKKTQAEVTEGNSKRAGDEI